MLASFNSQALSFPCYTFKFAEQRISRSRLQHRMVHPYPYLQTFQTDMIILLFYLISVAKRDDPNSRAALSWSCHYILFTGLPPLPDLFRISVDAKPNAQNPALFFFFRLSSQLGNSSFLVHQSWITWPFRIFQSSIGELLPPPLLLLPSLDSAPSEALLCLQRQNGVKVADARWRVKGKWY